MADRRTDDTPLAPRRPLTGSGEGQAKAGESSRRPVAERVTQRVSGAVASATESVKSAAESRRSEERKPSTPPAAKRPGGTTRPRTRKARLRMIHVDPWSVMKTAFLLSVAAGSRTWDGMSQFTGDWVMSALITFGIQGVMLIIAWLIGESFASGMNQMPGRSQRAISGRPRPQGARPVSGAALRLRGLP